MLMRSRHFYPIAVAGLLAACAAPITPGPATAEPVASATSTAKSVGPADQLATIDVQQTATALAPTPTRGPTRTPAPTDTPSGPSPTPDLEALNTYTHTEYSPDGQWVARWRIAETEDSRYLRFSLERADGSRRYVLVDGWEQWALGMSVPRIVRWSRDGRHVYYTNLPSPDGCVMFINGLDLWRVDLADGSQEQVVEYAGLMIFLAPDETTLLFAEKDGDGLALLDLASGDERFVPLDIREDAQAWEWDVVGAVWSPDESAILVTVYDGGCPPPEEGMVFTIVRLELVDLSVQTLIEQDDRQPVALFWPEPDVAVVQLADSSLWRMDPLTGEILGPYDES